MGLRAFQHKDFKYMRHFPIKNFSTSFPAEQFLSNLTNFGEKTPSVNGFYWEVVDIACFSYDTTTSH